MAESVSDEVKEETGQINVSDSTNDIQRTPSPPASTEHQDTTEERPESNDENASEVLHDTAELPDAEQSISESIADFDAEDGEDDNTEDINVIIKPTNKTGIYKTGATYQARSTGIAVQHTKASRQGIELDDPGDIHGVPTLEFNLSTLGEEEKPWKRPGADITDYFNYGFTEETWIQYCEKQKILRQEYANATLKPVLSSGGTGLLQRMRTGSSALSNRPFDNFKQANINVINLSSNANARGLLNAKATDAASTILNGVTGNSTGLLGDFTQPPPGYPAASAQTDGSAAFNAPPAAFPATQLLAGANTAGTAGIFPNLSLPPPIFNTLSNWPGAVGVPGLLAADTIIDPATGQISAMLDRSTRSPESVYSNDDHSSRRKVRHYRPGGDDGNYYDRESYRTRRRSRSDSRDRYHSRHHRHREAGRSDRDYDRRPVRRSHRSRDRFSRDERFSDDMADAETYPAPTSAGSYSRGERSSRDDRSRDDPSRGSHRTYKRERDRSSRSSRPGRHRSRTRSPRRREGASPPSRNSPSEDRGSHKNPSDPLRAVTAAAANIAMALGEGGSGKSMDS